MLTAATVGGTRIELRTIIDVVWVKNVNTCHDVFTTVQTLCTLLGAFGQQTPVHNNSPSSLIKIINYNIGHKYTETVEDWKCLLSSKIDSKSHEFEQCTHKRFD